MFKKKPHIKPLAPLRSSDRRKLSDQIISEYSLQTTSSSAEDQTPEQKAEATAAHTALRNSILPENAQSARFTTTHGPDLKQATGTLYVGSHDGQESRILWFQMDGRMYPSVYTLWKNPNIIPLLHTPEIVVSKLKGGADLMTPGLARGPPFPAKAVKDAVVAIASLDRPSVPVAVGSCEIDVSALQQVAGAKGHAVKTVHWAGDEAWAYGASGRPGQETPEDIEAWSQELEPGGLEEGMQTVTLEDADADGGVSLHNGGPSTAGVSNGENTNSVSEQPEEDALASKPESREFSQKEIDDAFRNAFLFGIYKQKANNARQHNFGLVFPLSPSLVMSALINPYLPAFTPDEEKQLQIKKTSWKNLKKFIKSLDKEQIIKSKDMNGNETVILDIDFDDAAITGFVPYAIPKKDTVNGSHGKGAGGHDRGDGNDDSIGQKLQVTRYFKPTARLSPLFTSSDKQLFSSSGVREIVTAYIEREQLISESNKRLVKLNPILANAVFDGSGALDREVLAKGSVPRDALIDRVLHSMNTSHAIVRNEADSSTAKAKSGAAPKIHITLEIRSGNKTVTKVSGLEPYFINPKLLADELRKVCAGSTNVEPVVGATKKNEKPIEEVMVQGPQKDAVVKALEKRGVDKAWVEVLDKTKGKKR